MTNFEKINILIVEDNEDDLYFIKKALTDIKYNLQVISSGTEAFYYLSEPEVKPDIVLLDYKLPGMSGIEILEKLQHKKNEYSFIFLTVDNTVETVVKAMKAGALDFVVKSTSLKFELPEKIEKIYEIHKHIIENLENQANLLSIIEAGNDSIWSIDKDFRYVFFNRYFAESYKTAYNIELKKGTNALEILPNELRHFWEPKYEAALKGEKQTFEFCEIIYNQPFFFEVRLNPIILNHTVAGVSAISADITERKSKERQLKYQANLLDLIFTNSLDSIVLLDKDYNFIKVSESYAKACNRDISEFEGKNHFELYPSSLKDEFDEAKTNKILYRKNARPFVFPDHPEWGVTYWDLALVPILTEQNEISLFLFTLKNATEQIITKQEIIYAKELAEANELKYKLLYNNTPVMMQSSDMKGFLISVNDYWLQIMGYELNEVIGTHTSAYLTEQSQTLYKNKIPDFIKNGSINNIEAQAIKKNGQLIDLLISSSILYNKEGQPEQTMTNLVVITEKKEAEKQQNILNQQLIIAKERAEEGDRMKTEFINNMSHEIRTPMNGILGFSQLLTKQGLPDDKRNFYVSIIQNSGNQLLRIIDDILEISKLGTKQVKVVNEEICLNDLFLDLFSIFDIKAKETKMPLYLKKGLSNQESTILCDRLKLNKILSNLLENAFKYTSHGFIEFGYKLKGSNLEIYVKDTGIGIREERQKIIFERFAQEDIELSQKKGGLGLGLSIAKENTELLGGSISVESQKDKGSTFYVTIPYKPVQSILNSETNENASLRKQKTVLIAEDEEVNFLYLEALIEDKFNDNCTVIHAKNGQEAVDFCMKNSDIDLILMDLKMPIVNGYEATKMIKKLRPDLPIVAQTAYSTADDREKAISYGCDDFISKPIKEDALYKIINKFLIV